MKSVESLSLVNTPGLARQKSGDKTARTLDTGLAHVRSMPKLRRLNLNGAKFSEQGLDEIAKMTELEALSLSGTLMSDDLLDRLTPLVNLRELDLSKTRITDKAFGVLMRFKNLEKLNVGTNISISGIGFRMARDEKGLSGLKHLAAAYTSWDDEGMKGVMKTPTLEYLDLGKTKVNDINLGAVTKLKDLQFIYLHEAEKLTSKGMKHLAACKELRTIFLLKSRGINDTGLTYFKGLKKLERLVLTETSCTVAGAKQLKKSLPDVAITMNQGQPPL
jgi:Leucine-rich repeat (LRR) protein